MESPAPRSFDINGIVVDVAAGMLRDRGGREVALRPQAFKALAQQKINIRAITTSEIKFSVLIDAEHTDSAVRTLHSLYGLDKA